MKRIPFGVVNTAWLVFALLLSTSAMARMPLDRTYDAAYDKTWDAVIWTIESTRGLSLFNQDRETGKIEFFKAPKFSEPAARIKMSVESLSPDQTKVSFDTEDATWTRSISQIFTGEFLRKVWLIVR